MASPGYPSAAGAVLAIIDFHLTHSDNTDYYNLSTQLPIIPLKNSLPAPNIHLIYIMQIPLSAKNRVNAVQGFCP